MLVKLPSLLLVCIAVAGDAQPASQQSAADLGTIQSLPGPETVDSTLISPELIGRYAPTIILVGILSLAPAIVLMTTCFVRIFVVLTILRHSLGVQNIPPMQVISALALFMTAALMSPAWLEIYHDAWQPYQSGELAAEDAIGKAASPVADFMARQIEHKQNTADVFLFLKHTDVDPESVESYDDIPFQVLAPAFLLSELKTSFLIGFRILLPFLIVDLVVAVVLSTLGLVSLPPSSVALPFKLLLFVMVDGWHLVVGGLLESFV